MAGPRRDENGRFSESKKLKAESKKSKRDTKKAAQGGNGQRGSNAASNSKPKRKLTPKELRERRHKTFKSRAKKSPKTAIRKEVPELLVATLEKAEKGSCQHTKLLLDIADIENMPDEAERKKAQSLAELLLEKIEESAER